MNRYITKRYVAVSWSEAVRLAKLDGTSLRDIKCQRNIELLHRTDWWAWWSDERLTTAIGLSEDFRPEALYTDAVMLMFDVWMGGLVAPKCGWATLAHVKRIVARQEICEANIPHRLVGHRAINSIWESLSVIDVHNRQRLLYRCCYEDEAGYHCNVII